MSSAPVCPPVCPPVWQSTDAELLAELGALETRLHSTWAQTLSVVAEIDSRSMASGLEYRSTVELVRAIARVSRGEARARVDAAADVLPRLGVNGTPVEPKLPATAAAVAEQAIGAADVAVIRSVLARIPPHLGTETRAEVEAELARHARTLDAGQLMILGRRILAYLDQDGRRPHDTPETKRRLSFRDRDGGYELSGRAVILRDRGCAFPGCSIPARWCEIHHIIHWVDNGPTSLDNCIALCGRHHRLIHHSHWLIEMAAGIPEFHPPPWLGGPPRRNPLHLSPDLIRIRQ